MKRKHYVGFFVVVVIAGVVYLSKRWEKTPQIGQGTACDASLWEHVYHGKFPSAEDRLEIQNPCLTVTGTIVNARAEADGDWHIRLDVDPQYKSLLNEANVDQQRGYLVVETVCSNPVTQRDTQREGVCNGFSQNLFSPEMIGTRVAVTGAYVLDRDHGWMEVHPVTSIVSVP
jgi:hypothetical protein